MEGLEDQQSASQVDSDGQAEHHATDEIYTVSRNPDGSTRTAHIPSAYQLNPELGKRRNKERKERERHEAAARSKRLGERWLL